MVRDGGGVRRVGKGWEGWGGVGEVEMIQSTTKQGGHTFCSISLNMAAASWALLVLE